MRSGMEFFTAKVLLLSLLIFVGGFYAARASVIDRSYDGTEPVTQRNVMKSTFPAPEVDWDGVCPRRCGTCPESYRENPLLLLISIDGFRPDYLERGFTPTLRNISKCGTAAPFMYPVFPTKTFPNHYSQVTGLYPVSHGIIDNTMHDPVTKKIFKLGDKEISESYWWSSEPIWVTAEKQGKKTGCFFWAGSDVKINNTLPTYYRKYDSAIPFQTRVETVLSWMDKPVDQRPSLLTLYFEEPDSAAHKHGTTSNLVNVELKRVDDAIAMLFAGLQQRGLLDCVNVMIMSDHGMANLACDKQISLPEFFNVSGVLAVTGTFGRIKVRGDTTTAAEENILESLRCGNKHMRVYRKENLPLRYHYASNPRIEPLFIDLDSGWIVTTYSKNTCYSLGGHGYDNLYPDMRGTFMAIGPSFKSHHTVDPFINTELYGLMAELLNITARPNNGTDGSLHHLLNDPKLLPPQPKYTLPPTLEVPSEASVVQANFQAAECSGSEVIEKLNMTSFDMEQIRFHHLPFGIPHCQFDCEEARLLHHSDYVSSFDVKYKLPLWTSYSMSKTSNLTDVETEPHWSADVRISHEDPMKCTFYKDPKVLLNAILQRPLFPLSFASNSETGLASLVTNSVPKTMDHVNRIEKTFNEMLLTWAEQEGSMNVVMGPAFDLLNTSVYPGSGSITQTREKYGPLVVPTHYYAVITWCKIRSVSLSYCEHSQLDVVAFLLPNDPVTYNCESPKDLIVKNAARVVDIEGLTGISFFTELPVYHAIRLRTAMPRRQLTF